MYSLLKWRVRGDSNPGTPASQASVLIRTRPRTLYRGVINPKYEVFRLRNSLHESSPIMHLNPLSISFMLLLSTFSVDMKGLFDWLVSWFYHVNPCILERGQVSAFKNRILPSVLTFMSKFLPKNGLTTSWNFAGNSKVAHTRKHFSPKTIS